MMVQKMYKVLRCFNTQPPEGGWAEDGILDKIKNSFNTQPPEGGWCHITKTSIFMVWFQHTAARRRLGNVLSPASFKKRVSTHSRPKAAGFSIIFMPQIVFVSTHSRPKAAGIILSNHLTFLLMFQHTAARRRLEFRSKIRHQNQSFQHTAARRRLVCTVASHTPSSQSFQHTAARRRLVFSLVFH